VRFRTPVAFALKNSDSQRDWLTLIRAPRLGGRRLIDLVECHGSAAGALAAARSRAGRLGIEADTSSALSAPDAQRLDADLDWLSGADHHLVTWDSERYPPLLRRISSPPAALFVAGDPEALWLPQLAIVGSRNPTAGGLDHARAFAAAMCRHGIAVTSGLASGIDHAAHQAALDCGGVTIAVTATGLDRVYPASSAATAGRIPARGAIVSEFPPGTTARRTHFPSRNRIIAGLSLGVLVVEAGVNSGSLITARQAAEQGRDVCALPGSLHNPMAKGCHRLIKEGARLVETSGEILQGLAPLAQELALELRHALEEDAAPQAGDSAPALPDDPDYARLWDLLGFDPKPIDALVAQSGLNVQQVSSMLLLLEMRGLVTAQPGSAYSRKA
jgi:DNA processing protein